MTQALADQDLKIHHADVAALLPSADNRVVNTKDQKFRDLVASIKAVGVIQPILIRRDGDAFRIIFGHYRVAASKAAGKLTIPAIIATANTEEAIELAMVENLHRTNMTALEEMAAFGELLARGKTVDAIATEIGKSTGYVFQRVILAKLIPAWQKALNEDHVSVGHAVIAARLQPEQQRTLLKRVAFNGNATLNMTVRQLWEFVQREFHCDLDHAPFDKDDPDLVPGAGTCVDCPKRTGAATQLFPEITKGEQCTDAVCYRKKRNRHVERVWADEKKSGDDVALLATEWGADLPNGAVPSWDYKIAKDGEHRGVICDGKDAGKVVRFDRVDHKRPGSADKVTESRKAAKKARLIQHTKDELFRRVVDVLDDGGIVKHRGIVFGAVTDVMLSAYRFETFRAVGKALRLDAEKKKGKAFDYERAVRTYLKGKASAVTAVIATIGIGLEKNSWKYGKLTIVEDVAKAFGIDPAGVERGMAHDAKMKADDKAKLKKTIKKLATKPKKAGGAVKKADRNKLEVVEGKPVKGTA